VTDHVLFGHVKEHLLESFEGSGLNVSRKLDCRLHSAVYYFHTNGGLTTADLINSITADSTTVYNSELFKSRLIAYVTDHSFNYA
jgi:hypothetical protein